MHVLNCFKIKSCWICHLLVRMQIAIVLVLNLFCYTLDVKEDL